MIRRPPRSTLFLHDALPISPVAFMSNIPYDGFNTNIGRKLSPHNAGYNVKNASVFMRSAARRGTRLNWPRFEDRKSTRLNSSHSQISYAVFCLKKKKKTHNK